MAVNLAKGLAPVVLFGYNRPQHILKTLDALNNNGLADQTDLYIFLDAAKEEADQLLVLEVIEVCEKFNWNGTKKVISLRHENHGLAKNIIDGVTRIVNQCGRVIVLEDDLETSEGFLTYMNEALELYEAEKQVMHVAGYMFPISLKSKSDTLFYQVTSCWGWATWADRWKHLNTDAQYLFDELNKREMTYWFDLDGSGMFLHQLEYNISGRFKTWAIKWQASVNLMDGLTLHPSKSLVRNIGFDNSGEHCREDSKYVKQDIAAEIEVKKIELNSSAELRIKMKNYYRDQSPTLPTRVLSKIKGKLRRSLNALTR
jgi:hypothetical protein